jgi:hypothetical protein
MVDERSPIVQEFRMRSFVGTPRRAATLAPRKHLEAREVSLFFDSSQRSYSPRVAKKQNQA